MKVGVVVSTYRRPNNLEKLIRSILGHTTPNDLVVGIDEQEDVASGAICKGLSVDYYRAPNKGVAVNKNRLIKILYDRGCDYIFLLEDDLIVVKDFIKPYVSAMESTSIPLMSGLHPDLVEFPNPKSIFSVIKSVQHQEFTIVYPSSCSNVFMVITRDLIERVGYFNTKQYKNKYGRIQTMWLDLAKISYICSGGKGAQWIEKRMGWPDIKQGRDTYRYIRVKQGMSEEDKAKEVQAFRESYFKYHSNPLTCIEYPEEKIVLRARSIDNSTT